RPLRRLSGAAAALLFAAAAAACSPGAAADPAAASAGAAPAAADPVGEHGLLRVCGTRLCGEDGEPVQLRGMSSHGLQWYDRWLCAERAERHAAKDNVLDESANEPNGVGWKEIKGYAEEVIPVIRGADPDSVVLVGTRAWSSLGVSEGSDEREVVEDPVDADNIMYTFHSYAASPDQEYPAARDRASQELPVFVTEFGTQGPAGEGENDFAMAQRYLDLMAERDIGWTNWNFSDDHRSGAVFEPGTCDAGGPWTGDALKPAGAWVQERIG